MIQLMDIPTEFTLEHKVCGMNRMFYAPEIQQESGQSTVTSKADVWGLGTLLYMLIAGGVMYRVVKDLSQQHKIFDFSEPVWSEVNT